MRTSAFLGNTLASTRKKVYPNQIKNAPRALRVIVENSGPNRAARLRAQALHFKKLPKPYKGSKLKKAVALGKCYSGVRLTSVVSSYFLGATNL